MRTSLKLFIAGLSALGFGLGTTLPAFAQSDFTPNAETAPQNTPGMSPYNNQGTQNNQNQTTPNNQQNNQNRNLPNTQTVPGNASPNATFSSSEAQSIDQIVRTSPSFELFNALLRVAESEGILVGQLAGDSNYTVLAPTDEALARVPAATFKALVQPENRDVLAQVLENHIVKGKVSSSDLAAQQVRSLSGNPLAAQGSAGSLSVGNARVIGADIQAENGIIHAIDQVILPADLQSRLTSLAPQPVMNQSAQ